MKKIREFKNTFLNEELIGATLEKMVDEGHLSKERSLILRESLPKNIKESKYILSNLAVHIVFGGIFAFDLIPLPLGTISRVSWVLGNRIYYTIKNDKEKKDVHSYKVLLVSAIPWIGYFAYTIPLKKVNEDLSYVYANHIIYLRKNKSLEAYLENKPKFVKKIMNNLLVPKNLRKI